MYSVIEKTSYFLSGPVPSLAATTQQKSVGTKRVLFFGACKLLFLDTAATGIATKATQL